MNDSTTSSRLQSLLAALSEARSWTSGTIEALGHFVRTADDVALLRVSPLQFAHDHHLSEKEGIDLFLFAAQVGLFQMDWVLFCASCGCIVEDLKSLELVHSHYRCELCAGETDAYLDDYIAVYFQIAPSVRPIVFHDPASLSAEAYYFEYKLTEATFFYGGIIEDVPEDIPTRDYFKARAKILDRVGPGEEKRFEIEVRPDFFAIDESVLKTQIFFQLSEDASPEQHFALVLGESSPAPIPIGPGKLSLQIKNPRDRTAHLMGVNLPLSLFQLRESGIRLDYALRGNQLLTNATFKELFRSEVLASQEGIGIRNMSILFSDLKGSTDLYDRVGDLKAFAMVREHFEQLARIVSHHSGVTVKTIGDAVMAAFTNPLDALHSACSILQEVADFNRSMGRDDIRLKLGVHHGSVIAVTLNERIDYFGQTVNIASRVQGLAEAEEICFTDSVYHYPGVADFLQAAEFHAEGAKLKGVAEKVRIYKMKAS